MTSQGNLSCCPFVSVSLLFMFDKGDTELLAEESATLASFELLLCTASDDKDPQFRLFRD